LPERIRFISVGARWPNLTALELLVGIDDWGSLGSASRRIGIAQPNASRLIRQLERRFGASLVERSPRGSTLTAHGTVIVHWGRQILGDARELLNAADALRAEREAHLTIAASMTVAEYLLPGWLARFRRTTPGVHVHLQMLNSAQVFDRVISGSCDLGFVESPSVPPELYKVPVASDHLVVVVEPGHAWTQRRRPLTPHDLAQTPLVAREPGSGTRSTLDNALQEFDRPAPLLELASSAAIRASVLEGVGPAVLSSLAVIGELRSGALYAVKTEGLDLRRTLHAVWRRRGQLDGPAARLVAEILREARAKG